MQDVAVGVLKESKAIDVKCAGVDCQGDHRTYDCKDVLFLLEAIPIEEAQEHPVLVQCLADGRMAATKTRALPTMLGIWWEAVCDN